MTRSRQLLPADQAWEAVVERDAGHDGRFVFAVRTTGVYCRPSCPARRPRRENVEFFRTGDLAREAGFRSCKRCRPDEPAVDRIAAARRLLDAADGTPVRLEELAGQVGLSAGHLQRQFKARFGLSPRQWQSARRNNRLRKGLRQAGAGAVSRAGYDAGFGSSSRVYDQAAATLGMTPGRFARGGAGVDISYAVADSEHGRVLVAATERGVCAVLFGDTDSEVKAALREEFPEARLQPVGRGSAFEGLVAAVVAAIAGRTDSGAIPLDIVGTALQQQVWQALRQVSRGTTVSYAELADRVGRPRAVRAVASAVARNRLAVLIPCHRVVRSDGGMGGYRWGVNTKARLLAAEG